MRTVYLFILFDEGKNGDSLYSFSKTHIVGKDTTDSTLIKTYHPIQTHKLIIFKLPSFEQGGLLSQSGKDVLFVLL